MTLKIEIKLFKVARSSFSINGQTLLTRLGGSVSSGRTLVWIILTILATSKVGYLCNTCVILVQYLCNTCAILLTLVWIILTILATSKVSYHLITTH